MREGVRTLGATLGVVVLLAAVRVDHFDDPGCLLLAWGERDAADGAPDLWFHHHRDDRWLAGSEVAFVDGVQTPMGYGLGAVAAQEGGSLGLEAALDRVRTQERRRSAPAGGPRP